MAWFKPFVKICLMNLLQGLLEHRMLPSRLPWLIPRASHKKIKALIAVTQCFILLFLSAPPAHGHGNHQKSWSGCLLTDSGRFSKLHLPVFCFTPLNESPPLQFASQPPLHFDPISTGWPPSNLTTSCLTWGFLEARAPKKCPASYPQPTNEETACHRAL